MQLAVIVEPNAGPLDKVNARIRTAGFTERLDVFAQPTADVTGLNLDNTFFRKLKDVHFYNELWRNIVHWFVKENGPEQHLCILDGSYELCVSAADTLKHALAQPVAWGLISLYIPARHAFYFNQSGVGWNGVSLPMPLAGTCLSRQAANTLLSDPQVWGLDPTTEDFGFAIIDAMKRRSLIQAAHYPSLMTPTDAAGEPGLNYASDAVYVKKE